MIEPIYFPFTYLPSSVADILFACFKTTTVYGLSDETLNENFKKWIQTGRIHHRIPVKMNMAILASILKNYQSWAELHQGGVLEYLKYHIEGTPFFNDVAISQIIKDIKAQTTIDFFENNQDVADNNALSIGLFLYMSEIYDIQTNEMSSILHKFEIRKEDFFSGLRQGDEVLFRNILDKTTGIPSDNGGYMTAERIRSWVWLMGHDTVNPEFFITSSPSVIVFLKDQDKTLEKVLQLPTSKDTVLSESVSSSIERWRDRFHQYLELLLKGVIDPDVIQPFSLSIYFASGQTLYDFFSDLLGPLKPQNPKELNGVVPKNVFIGLIQT